MIAVWLSTDTILGYLGGTVKGLVGLIDGIKAGQNTSSADVIYT